MRNNIYLAIATLVFWVSIYFAVYTVSQQMVRDSFYDQCVLAKQLPYDCMAFEEWINF